MKFNGKKLIFIPPMFTILYVFFRLTSLPFPFLQNTYVVTLYSTLVILFYLACLGLLCFFAYGKKYKDVAYILLGVLLSIIAYPLAIFLFLGFFAGLSHTNVP
jgi:hypothetical protein